MRDKLRSITNALQSRNGHFNHSVDQNNHLWGSLCRLAEQIERDIDRFSVYVWHNFNRPTRNFPMRCQSTGVIEMEAQATFYSSTGLYCECGETSLLSAISDIPIPCRHQLRFGASRPKMDAPPELIFDDSDKGFKFDSVIRINQQVANLRRSMVKLNKLPPLVPMFLEIEIVDAARCTGCNELLPRWMIQELLSFIDCLYPPCRLLIRNLCRLFRTELVAHPYPMNEPD
jgi:hypothetical protein